MGPSTPDSPAPVQISSGPATPTPGRPGASPMGDSPWPKPARKRCVSIRATAGRVNAWCRAPAQSPGGASPLALVPEELAHDGPQLIGLDEGTIVAVVGIDHLEGALGNALGDPQRLLGQEQPVRVHPDREH